MMASLFRIPLATNDSISTGHIVIEIRTLHGNIRPFSVLLYNINACRYKMTQFLHATLNTNNVLVIGEYQLYMNSVAAYQTVFMNAIDL